MINFWRGDSNVVNVFLNKIDLLDKEISELIGKFSGAIVRW